jgi:hypothetical protein
VIKKLLYNHIYRRLSRRSRRKAKNWVHDFKAFFAGGNLDKLGHIYGTDKVGLHHYTGHYRMHLGRFKTKRINLLEIGVGGYEHPDRGGESLRMWKRYFRKAHIYSIDIHDKAELQENRITIFKGSQVDAEFLDSVCRHIGEIDVIIDDGSHINEHVIETFKMLFPKLKDGGVYVIEDTQTSYWEDYGGDSTDLRNPKTMMNFFKDMVDSLNNEEFMIEGYQKSYYDQHVVSMHFYHNMVFIHKGKNDEKSNMVENNRRTARYAKPA